MNKINILLFISIWYYYSIKNIYAWTNCPFWLCKVDDWIKWTTEVNIEVSANNTIEYILSFLGLVAIIFILWAWFNIMTAAWDDEKIKKWKNTIIYSIVWIIIIFFAYQFVTFILDWFK